MSFIVEGLDIPKEGQLLSINIYPDGKVTYNMDLDCKQIAVAKSVPTPHGRLIDVSTAYQNTMKYGNGTRKLFMKFIDELPTVMEAEE